MQSPHEVVLYSPAAQAYAAGYALHGELNLPLETYTSRLICIVKNHSGETPLPEGSLAVFGRLHTKDLYLSIACAHGSESAWERFWTVYQKHVRAVANSVSQPRSDARDLADSILSNLCLPDCSGCSSIGSYEGMGPLASWLHSVIERRAKKERDRKCNQFESIDDLPEIADHKPARRIEDELRAGRCKPLIRGAFIDLAKTITDRERSVLTLHYVQALKCNEIAKMLDVHPSTVTRQLQRACDKVAERIVSTLSAKHGLSSLAIEECIAEIVENPGYSLLAMIFPEETS